MKQILIFLLLLSTLYSAPARGTQRVFEQEDGITFIGKAKGNQHLNWIESSDGEILKYNPTTKNYELAEIKDNSLAPSGVKYNSTTRKAQGINSLKKEDVYKLWETKQEIHRLKMKSPKH